MFDYYDYSLFASWVILFFLGLDFFLTSAPKKDIFYTYNRARKLLAIAMWVLCLEVFLHWLFNFRSTLPHIASSLNITTYYLISIILGMSFISLINPSYINKKRVIRDFSKYLLLMIIMWPGIIICDQPVRSGILIFSSLYFFFDTTRLILVFINEYKFAMKEVDNYYSDNIGNFVKWIYRAVMSSCVLSPLAIFFIFASRFYNAIFMSIGTIIFSYIFVSFQNYILHYRKVSKVVLDESTSNINYSKSDLENLFARINDISSNKGNSNSDGYDSFSLHNEIIRKRLVEWCSLKHFLKAGITVASLASEVGTNRTVMSAFINKEFKCNFREWINKMRIDEAMKMLINDNMTVEQVSNNCGFSSSSFFIKQFIKATGSSPAKWRKNYIS